MEFEIRRLTPDDIDDVLAAGRLFDNEPIRATTERFLGEPNHHMLFAYDGAGVAIGFVTGVATTHPDKGTEMFLYELSVAAEARRHGVGAALVEALAALARSSGHYGMWAGTETDNVAAQRTYQRAGAKTTPAQLIIEWNFGE